MNIVIFLSMKRPTPQGALACAHPAGIGEEGAAILHLFTTPPLPLFTTPPLFSSTLFLSSLHHSSTPLFTTPLPQVPPQPSLGVVVEQEEWSTATVLATYSAISRSVGAGFIAVAMLCKTFG